MGCFDLRPLARDAMLPAVYRRVLRVAHSKGPAGETLAVPVVW
jgi:hypothetical protein